MTNRIEELKQAQQTLKQIRQTLESQTILEVAGADRQRSLKSSLTSIERELASIQKEAEIRDDPVSRMARGDESDEVLGAVVLYETPSD